MIILVPNFTPLRDKLWHSDAGQNILDLLAQLRSVLKFLCISLTGINPGLKCWPEMICKVVQPLTKVLVLLFTCKSLRRFFCFRSSNLGSYNLPKLWSQHHYWSKARPHWTRYKCMSCAFVHGLSINLIFFVQSLTNGGDFHASEWFLSSSVLSSHLSASDLPGSCWFHPRWYCIDSSSSTSSWVFNMPFSTNHACNMLQVKKAGIRKCHTIKTSLGTSVWYEQADMSKHKYRHAISYMLQYIQIVSNQSDHESISYITFLILSVSYLTLVTPSQPVPQQIATRPGSPGPSDA